MPESTHRVGKRGVVIILAALRRRFGIEEGYVFHSPGISSFCVPSILFFAS
jgi:hypothetical protein